MNKKSKRITLGLVSALCLLLVVALGFGVTGAWYRARRQATGIVKLDKGIELKTTNLYQSGKADPTGTSTNYLWVLNEGKTDLVQLNESNVPGHSQLVAIPTIAKNTATSTDFYAKAKVFYQFELINEDKSAVATKYEIGSLYKNAYAGEAQTAWTIADIFGNGNLTFTSEWKEFHTTTSSVPADTYFYVANQSATELKVFNTTTATALFVADNSQPTLGSTPSTEASAASYATIALDDWTEPTPQQLGLGDGTGYVEFGGPAVYLANGTTKMYITKINIAVVIDVIQADNVVTTTGTYTEVGSALKTWAEATIASPFAA